MDDLYRKLFDEMPCFVTTQNREFRIIAANNMFRKEFGREENSYCYEVYKGRKEKCPSCPLERTFRDGKPHRSEEIVRLRDGKELVVIAFTSPIRDESGEIVAAVEVSADITEVKHLQEKYRTLFDVVPCYISVQDRDFRISDTSGRFRADFGDGTGDTCYNVYKHRSEPCLDCPVAKTFEDGLVHQSEEVVTNREGSRRNVLVYTAPIRNPLGDIESVMEMSTDITDLRQLQSRLTSLGMLVGSISHGIKGLLSGLDGGIYLLETGLSKNKPDRLKKGLDMVERNAERIRNMVLNVLYYAKDRPVIWDSVEVSELTSSVAEILANRADKLGVKIEIESESGMVECDRHAIHAMLVNLVENSLDACHSDKRDIEHKVNFSATFEDDQAAFTIRDNGIGMDQETKEKAFSLFFSSKGAAGTGLGLFIAQKIVNNHQGSINIESTPGQGTSFIIKLPLSRSPELNDDDHFQEQAPADSY